VSWVCHRTIVIPILLNGPRDNNRRMAVIHCRNCGLDNIVADDVVGKLCDQCSMDIYLPEIERLPERPVPSRTAPAACCASPARTVTRSVNFQTWSDVDIFICGEPVAVEEPVQSVPRRRPGIMTIC
jgi:hypothetical protein